MEEKKQISSQKRRRGRPPKHGGYSLIVRDDILKEHPRLRQYLQDCRDGLVRDIGGSEENLTEAQRILIDRIISKLSICRLIEIYIEKYGIFRRDKIKKRVLELEPALGVNYLAFDNSIRLSLQALGIDKKHNEGVLDLGKYLEKKEKNERRMK